MKAIISHQPYNRYMGEPDVIETIDITNCLVVLNYLRSLAQFVNKAPDEYGIVAKQFAYLIRQIEMALEPQLSILKMKMKEG